VDSSGAALPVLGIDLGTTFCCTAYLDARGEPRVVPGADGGPVTPSVIRFTGSEAWVGEAALRFRGRVDPRQLLEFVKRDMGQPSDQPRYRFRDFDWGAEGMSALILSRLRLDALRHLREHEGATLADDAPLPAVITVPAYFGYRQRLATRVAGEAAGLRVEAILNEPTAAALAVGTLGAAGEHILVFDLGGGTFDVTILQLRAGRTRVLASGGLSEAGGIDVDEVIARHLHAVFRQRNGVPVPAEAAHELERLAVEAKHALGRAGKHRVRFACEAGELDETLFRTRPAGRVRVGDGEALGPLYLDQAAGDLLQRCRARCRDVLRRATVEVDGGRSRPMTWEDLDEVVLAGGASHLPAVAAMLHEFCGRPVRQLEGGGGSVLGYQTAVAVGAACYGGHRMRVDDVLARSIGVLVLREGVPRVHHLLGENHPIPGESAASFPADPFAPLSIYENESDDPGKCELLGRIQLENPAGEVHVTLRMSAEGLLTATTRFPGHLAVHAVEPGEHTFAERVRVLRERLAAVRILEKEEQ
jgi:molecular chaperone DnaK